MGATTIARGVVNISLAHRIKNDMRIDIQAFIVTNVCGPLPYKPFESPFADAIAMDELADPAFNQPGGIELLLGAGAWAAIIDGNETVLKLKQYARLLGNSISTARACFYGIEKRMLKDPSLRAKYKAVFDDYRELRHMVLAPEKPKDDAESYYLPHHPINTTDGKGKFRVVFNASAATTTGVSYNEQQLAGPKLQDDLISIFLRFRAKRFGMTADIRQMFRQVDITPEQWNFQRLLWRDAPSDKLREYVITVVCWGQASAGFNAVRAVRQCAVDEQHNYPTGARIAMSDCYYDDLLSGANTEAELCDAYHQVAWLLRSGGFELAKWATNSTALAAVLKDEFLVGRIQQLSYTG